MNNKTLLIVVLVGGLFLWALILRNGDLLLLAVPLLVYLLAGLFLAPSSLEISARRTLSHSALNEGEIAQVSIGLQNEGPKLPRLILEDSRFPELEIVDGQLRQGYLLEEGGEIELIYRFRASRGFYTWDSIEAAASDPFGLFEKVQHIPAEGELTIYPERLRIKKIPFQPRSTIHASGLVPSHLAGAGTDFWGVREFREGDTLRQVNWRLGARYPGELFSNMYQKEEIADFGLILDARESTSVRAAGRDLFEYSVSAAAAISERLIQEGNRVSLLVFGEVMQAVFPGSGRTQQLRIQNELVRSKLRKNIPMGYLEYLPVRLFPSGSLIVVFSGYNARDYQTFARLLALGYEVLLICPDQVEYYSRTIANNRLNNLAIRAARIDRIISLDQLVKLGVRIVDWQVDQPLALALHSAAERFSRPKEMIKKT